VYGVILNAGVLNMGTANNFTTLAGMVPAVMLIPSQSVIDITTTHTCESMFPKAALLRGADGRGIILVVIGWAVLVRCSCGLCAQQKQRAPRINLLTSTRGPQQVAQNARR
jgi:hypothetical protein